MSTFTYDNAAPVLRDSTVVRHFRVNTPDEYLTRLNLDLGTALTVQDFLRIQVFYAGTAMRDPTVGELRLLDAITQRGSYAPGHIAVGELTTSSPALAETWTDMMEKRSALIGSAVTSRTKKPQTPPCSLTDALDLMGHYLYRGELRHSEDTVMVSSPRQEAVAAAAGYAPLAGIRAGDVTRSLWKRREPVLEETPCRAGDMLLYLPRLTLNQVRSLVSTEAGKRSPAIGAIRALTEGSLLSTILGLCPAADLYAARLPGAMQKDSDSPTIPFRVLCGRPSVTGDGACGYVLRVPMRKMPDVSQSLQESNIPFVVCGQARMDGNLSILLPDVGGLGEYPAVTLPPDLLLNMAKPRLCSMNPEALDIPYPEGAHLPLSRLPATSREANGLTPDGREAVALTLLDGRILTIPEANTVMTVLHVEIPLSTTAYSAAAKATADAALALEAAGISPAQVRLSASLSVADHGILTDGPALAAICGIYCAAAQLTAPVEDSIIETVSSSIPLTLTVTAWAEAPRSEAIADDRQWRTSGEPVHKESVAYVLPVLRKAYEGNLLALSAALNRNHSAACSLRPLAVNTVTDKETGTVSYALHPDSIQKLLDELNQLVIPVFSMNREDTRLILSHPAVEDALRRRGENGWSTLVLGEACSVFAEHGLLPAPLAHTTAVPVGGDTATVTYAFPAEPATRLLRATPMAPAHISEAMEHRHLAELHPANGVVIPDGFVSVDGTVLGILNGLDTTLLPKIQQFRFDLT